MIKWQTQIPTRARQPGSIRPPLPIWLRPPQPSGISSRLLWGSEGWEMRLLGVHVAACSWQLVLQPIQPLLLHLAERPPRHQGEIFQTHPGSQTTLSPAPRPKD